MRKKIIVFLLLSIIFFIGHTNNSIVEEIAIKDNLKIKALENENVIELDLNKYVIGVVACEMPALFNEEALKAMAVAARTYAIYKINNSNKDYDVTLTKNDQCYNTIDEMKEKWNDDFDIYYAKISKIVESTNDEIMTYNNEAILALYFSISNGYTENVEDVFSEKRDYLVSVESSVDGEYSYKESKKEFKTKEFLNKLNINSEKISDINIERNKTNRVNKITINDKTFDGTEFRKILELNSTDFIISEEEEKVIITTKGKGHGVGMSQYGANAMAKSGKTYKEILGHYYNNIEITNKY